MAVIEVTMCEAHQPRMYLFVQRRGAMEAVLPLVLQHHRRVHAAVELRHTQIDERCDFFKTHGAFTSRTCSPRTGKLSARVRWPRGTYKALCTSSRSAWPTPTPVRDGDGYGSGPASPPRTARCSNVELAPLPSSWCNSSSCTSLALGNGRARQRARRDWARTRCSVSKLRISMPSKINTHRHT